MQIRLQDGTLSACPLWPIWPAVFIWKSALVITLSELESWKYDLFRHITINRRGFIHGNWDALTHPPGWHLHIPRKVCENGKIKFEYIMHNVMKWSHSTTSLIQNNMEGNESTLTYWQKLVNCCNDTICFLFFLCKFRGSLETRGIRKHLITGQLCWTACDFVMMTCLYDNTGFNRSNLRESVI